METKRSKGKIIAVVVVALAALAGGALYFGGHFGGGGHSEAEHKGEVYTCGMHPWIISDKPGLCPICQMQLTKVESLPEPAKAPAAKKDDDFFSDMGGKQTGERKLLFYRNPMNPMVTSPTPAKDEMGMDYIPVYSDEAEAPVGVEGMATIRAGEESLRLAGVRTAQATRAQVNRVARAVGVVVPDETRVRRVQTKVEGYVEKLFVNVTGQAVAKGQPLLSLYSPELLASQEEFVRARDTARKFASSPNADTKALGEELMASARRRLELFDVPASVVRDLEAGGTPTRTVTLTSPAGGYVLVKDVFEGQKVEPGMELMTVADLSRVWVEADLYEYEAASVRVGQEAYLTLPARPGERLTGKVTFLTPFLSPETRTLKARFEFPNPGLALKPQMFADVTLALETGEGVSIPDSAVMDTGVRRVVFVETSPGTFEPREVTLGPRGEGVALVLAGVREGEKVVVKANFLLDSESRLRAAIIKQSAGAAR